MVSFTKRRVTAVGEWVVVEYKVSSGRRVKLWSFPSFGDADTFRLKRGALYQSVGLEKKLGLTPAVPRVSRMEMELFEEIIQNPKQMRRIKHQFHC